jgi:hypothetical protein
MLVPSQKEKHLYLKPVSLGVLIKFFKKGIVLNVFQQDLGIEPFRQFQRQTCFADPQRTFDYDMMMWIADVDSPFAKDVDDVP